MAAIRLEGAVKIYPFTSLKGKIFGRKKAREALEREKKQPYATSEGVIALRRTWLDIPDGSFTVLTGPSGCGKTTLLRLIAGLESLTDGELYFDGRPVSSLPPEKRDAALVSQNLALYPHLTVYDNIAFPLRNRRLPRHEIEEKVRLAAEALGLESKLDKRAL
jgi:ABC-type sugar transport system ATPase subunit